MPDFLRIRIPWLDRFNRDIERLPGKRGEIIRRNYDALGRRVGFIMRRVLKPHYHTGSLSDSIGHEIDGNRLLVGPVEKSGGWDRGLMLEMGTGPHAPPFEAIRRWAEFRGLPAGAAGAVWMSIKQKGTKAHPFLDDVIAQGDFRTALENTAGRIGLDLVGYAFRSLGRRGNAGAQLLAERPSDFGSWG